MMTFKKKTPKLIRIITRRNMLSPSKYYLGDDLNGCLEAASLHFGKNFKYSIIASNCDSRNALNKIVDYVYSLYYSLKIKINNK